MTLSLSFTGYLALKNIVTLKDKLGATKGHWKWHRSIERIYLLAFNGNYCPVFITSESDRHKGRFCSINIAIFFIPVLHNNPEQIVNIFCAVFSQPSQIHGLKQVV